MLQQVQELEDKPGHLARRFQQIAVAVFQAEMDRLGSDITPVQYAALAAVAARPGIDQATLAGLIAFDRATITGVLDRLEAKGLLNRQTSARDRRAREVHLTPQGHETLARIRPGVDRAQLAMVSGLSVPEAAELMRLFKKAVAGANGLSRAPMK